MSRSIRFIIIIIIHVLCIHNFVMSTRLVGKAQLSALRKKKRKPTFQNVLRICPTIWNINRQDRIRYQLSFAKAKQENWELAQPFDLIALWELRFTHKRDMAKHMCQSASRRSSILHFGMVIYSSYGTYQLLFFSLSRYWFSANSRIIQRCMR